MRGVEIRARLTSIVKGLDRVNTNVALLGNADFLQPDPSQLFHNYGSALNENLRVELDTSANMIVGTE
jgi:hypothetical protein